MNLWQGNKRMNDQSTGSLQQALHNENFIQLTTFRKSGEGVPTAVWFALQNERIYFFTLGTSGKVKRIRNNGRVQFRACDRAGNPKPGSTVFSGQARLLNDSEAATADQLLTGKYGWQKRLFDLSFLISGRSKQRAYAEIVGDPA